MRLKNYFNIFFLIVLIFMFKAAAFGVFDRDEPQFTMPSGICVKFFHEVEAVTSAQEDPVSRAEAIREALAGLAANLRRFYVETSASQDLVSELEWLERLERLEREIQRMYPLDEQGKLIVSQASGLIHSVEEALSHLEQQGIYIQDMCL